MNIEPIAHIESPFHTKFGVPRQAGLAPSVQSTIVFEEKYANPDALRKIEEYSRLWLIWGFSQNICEGKEWSALVRPPRLGGNEKAGVFATRSPFRPNNLGLSCVKLVGVQERTFKTGKTHKGYTKRKVLVVAGADLVDGTPIYDIKPYMPYSDAFPDAAAGFVRNKPDRILEVICPPEVEQFLLQGGRQCHEGRQCYEGWQWRDEIAPQHDKGVCQGEQRQDEQQQQEEGQRQENHSSQEMEVQALFECLSRDPRPAYHENTCAERIYGFEFGPWDIKFSVDDEKETLSIVSASKL